MIIEDLLTMWWGLFQAGYRIPPPKQEARETRLEYIERAKGVVDEFRRGG